MKGIVFTELLDLVEEKFGYEVVDQIIQASDLPSGGAYTAIGTYDHSEILQLVAQLSRVTNLPGPELLQMFGQYLFGRFVERYPEIFEERQDLFAFLGQLNSHIHATMGRLHPDATLPSFQFTQLNSAEIQMFYQSERRMEDLAEGLLLGCAAHFREVIELRREVCSEAGIDGVRFHLARLQHCVQSAA